MAGELLYSGVDASHRLVRCIVQPSLKLDCNCAPAPGAGGGACEWSALIGTWDIDSTDQSWSGEEVVTYMGCSWHLEYSDAWLSATPNSGLSHGYLTIHADANSGASRTGYIYVKNDVAATGIPIGTTVATVTVNQTGSFLIEPVMRAAQERFLAVSPSSFGYEFPKSRYDSLCNPISAINVATTPKNTLFGASATTVQVPADHFYDNDLACADVNGFTTGAGEGTAINILPGSPAGTFAAALVNDVVQIIEASRSTYWQIDGSNLPISSGYTAPPVYTALDIWGSPSAPVATAANYITVYNQCRTALNKLLWIYRTGGMYGLFTLKYLKQGIGGDSDPVVAFNAAVADWNSAVDAALADSSAFSPYVFEQMAVSAGPFYIFNLQRCRGQLRYDATYFINGGTIKSYIGLGHDSTPDGLGSFSDPIPGSPVYDKTLNLFETVPIAGIYQSAIVPTPEPAWFQILGVSSKSYGWNTTRSASYNAIAINPIFVYISF